MIRDITEVIGDSGTTGIAKTTTEIHMIGF
jgi:hypothetical protein